MKKKSTPWALWTLLITGITYTNHLMAAESYDTSPFDGFYVGGGLGGSFSNAKERTHTSSTANFNIPFNPPGNAPVLLNVNAILNNSSTHAHRKSRPAAGLYAGYGSVGCDNSYYLGLEAFVNYSGYKTKSKNNLPFNNTFNGGFIQQLALSGSNNFTTVIINQNKLQRYESGADLRPGIFLTPCTLLYARIGAGYNRWKLSAKVNTLYTGNSTLNIQTNPVTFSQLAALSTSNNFNRNKKIGTLRLGFGLEQNICENIAIRADYVNTSYRNIQVKRTFSVGDANGNTASFTSTTTIRGLSNNAVMLGLSYYW